MNHANALSLWECDTETCTFMYSQTATCGLRRFLRSTLPAVLWVSLIGVPLRRWVGVPLRRWGSHRPHWLLWIRRVWGCWPRARIWWRVLWVHQEPGNAPKRQKNKKIICIWKSLEKNFQLMRSFTKCLKGASTTLESL